MVIGLDLISCSPHIRLGDIHNMPFDDNSFDVVICGWVLGYSKQPEKAIGQILRVGCDFGIVAFGLEYVPIVNNFARQQSDRDPRLISVSDDSQSLNGCDELITLLGHHSNNVFFRHDAPLRHLSKSDLVERTGLGSSRVMLVASINK